VQLEFNYSFIVHTRVAGASDWAGPGWLGPAQPPWAELGPAQNKKIKK